MHFDDRLATVLNQPVSGEAIARIQFVQLLDLLGTLPSQAHGEEASPAYSRLMELASVIRVEDQARLLRESGLRLRSPRIVALLADGDQSVASAAIGMAELREEEWLDLIPALPVRSRGILRHRRDLGNTVEDRLERLGITDRGLPPAEAVSEVMDEVAPERAAEQSGEPDGSGGIGAIVRRIEAYRKENPPRAPVRDFETPRLPLGDSDYGAPPASINRFDFVTDPNGRVIHADPIVAPMLVGHLICGAEGNSDQASSPALALAVRLRIPIERQVLTISAAPPISGDWQIDAAPIFDERTGNFTGHAGRARRMPAPVAQPALPKHEGDLMRQILHELRNPAGAIQMAAELIQQQQLAVPVPHEYRAIAASIASDTAFILAGFDELDRLVKLDAGVAVFEEGTSDLAAIVARTVEQVHAYSEQRKSGFALNLEQSPGPVAVDEDELARLVWRLLAGIAGAAGSMEMLGLLVMEDGDFVRLEISLPQNLAELDDTQLFQAHTGDRTRTLASGMFGLGFTLRLARAEAGAAGGSLCREDDRLVLTLPLLAQGSRNVSIK